MGTEIQIVEALNDIECDPKVIERRTALFNKYIMPFLNMIYKLCKNYSNAPQNVDENYSDVLVNFYRRIETYDTSRPIHAWIHTCVKRQVWASEKRRAAHYNKDYDNDIEDYAEELIDDEHISSSVLGIDNWREYYSPDIVSVLDEMNHVHRDALILQEAGYSLKEIAEIEYKKGSLKQPNIETIKSRLRVARFYLKDNITRNGQRIPRKTDDSDVS